MTLEEAKIKAAENMEAQDSSKKDPFAIPFESAEAAKSMIGKTLRSRKTENKNVIEIVEWIGQNYVLCTNGTDYSVAPVTYILSKLDQMLVA